MNNKTLAEQTKDMFNTLEGMFITTLGSALNASGSSLLEIIADLGDEERELIVNYANLLQTTKTYSIDVAAKLDKLDKLDDIEKKMDKLLEVSKNK